MSSSVTFADENREKAIRRRAEYDDNNPGDLVLSIPRLDGGTLSIPLLKNARSNIEQHEFQENTLLRVKPLAEVANNFPLSGRTRVYRGKGVALLRPGYLYIFRNDTLWRELVINEAGYMSDIDLRRARAEYNGVDSSDNSTRPGVGKWIADVLVPVFLQGVGVMHQFRMAYSEVQWDWGYIHNLEQDGSAREVRTTGIGHAWAAANVDTLTFATGFSAAGIKHVAKLRARDLGIELMLENPLDFVSEFEGPDEQELCVRLGKRLNKQEKSDALSQPESSAADETSNRQKPHDTTPLDIDISCPPGGDLLADQRRQEGLVCVSIPDPLFKLRHSLTQLHLALYYLDAVDATIQQNPMSHSAMLIRQAVFDPTLKGGKSSLAKYAEAIDLTKLDEMLDAGEKNHAIAVIERHVAQLKSLMSGRELLSVWEDYRNRNDGAISEAYLLIADKLNLLQQIPGVLKAQGVAGNFALFGALKRWLVDSDLLAKWAPEQSLQLERLKRLVQDQTDIDESVLSKLNLQSLIFLEKQLKEKQSEEGEAAENVSGAGKVGALVSGALDEWSSAILTVCKRLIEEDAIKQIGIQRVMQAASSNFVLTDPNLNGIDLMDRAGARMKGSILGVYGNGVNRGLSKIDRTEVLTRAKDYLTADLLDDSGELMASTSPSRAANALEEAIHKTAGGITVFFVPDGHPEAQKLSLTKVDFAKRVGKVVDGPTVSRGLVVLAAFNVFLETNNVLRVLQAADGNLSLAASKTLGAMADLTAASLKLSQVLGEQAGSTSRVYRLATRPLFDMKNVWLIGKRLQTVGAQTLLRTVGLVSFIGAGVGAGLSFWEWRISLANKDFDAAAGHALAMTGGMIFMMNPLLAGVLGIPGWGWAVLGMGMVVGGGLYAGNTADDPFEKLLKLGPFGIYPTEASSGIEEKAYYSQLLSLLTPIRVTAQQYADIDPDPDLTHSGEQPAPDDYVITLQTPLISRLKITSKSLSEALPNPFSLVVQEVAYLSSSMASSSAGKVETDQVLSTTLLRKITGRQSLPHQSAVRFLVKREIPESDYSRFGYSQSITTSVRVGLQAVVDTELGPLVFPAPVHENYEAFNRKRHGTPPLKSRSLLNPYSQPESPYWFFTEVFV
ncbi:hypothetical protein [Marinobacter sediminicola]|uniref:hypothetical protein n=1 Tax=Marinobacter sediminicola TaxID=3072994 RepID=UPI002811A495|nr:hypothetical protein [Marinobacter sp. F26243]